LAVNTSLEYLFIDYNNLNYDSISNLLESLLLNRSLKVVSLLGNQRKEAFLANCAKLLAKVLKASAVQSLSVDLNEHCACLQELGQALFENNSELTEIPPLEEVAEPSTAVKFIWACLKANRWIHSKLQDPSADLDIDADFQEVLEAKLARLKEEEAAPRIKIEENVEVPVIDTPQFSSFPVKNFKIDQNFEVFQKNEEDLIAQAYNSPREEITEEKSLISTSIFNDSPRNFTYSESSKSGTPNLESPRLAFEKDSLKLLHRYLRNHEDRFVAALETLKLELSKEIQHLIQNSAENQTQVEKISQDFLKIENVVKNNEKKTTAVFKGLEKGVENLEFRVSGLEKGEKFRAQELSETRAELSGLRESLKDQNTKLEKYELNNKLQINSMKKTMTKRQDFLALIEKQSSFSAELQTLAVNFSMIDGNSEKLKQIIAGLQRTEKILIKKKEDHEVSLQELKQKMFHLEEKIEDLPNVSTFSHSFQKDFDAKLAKLELRVWESLESDSTKEARSSSQKTTEKKILLLDEKINKVYENLMEISKNLSKFEGLRISERLEKLEKEVLQQNIKNTQTISVQESKRPLKVQENVENFRSHSSFKKYSTRNSPFLRPGNGFPEEDLSGRSEEKDFRQVFHESRLKHKDAVEYLPGEAESIVLSAIIDKANKSRAPCMRKSFSTISLMPNPQTTTAKSSAGFKRFAEDILPSPELQESLKQRGINF
jgi:hypothetical protein